jgi:hypothetical protein
MKEEIQSRKSITEMIEDNPIPLQEMSKMNSSQPFLAEIHHYSTIEPKQNIIIQGVSQFSFSDEKKNLSFIAGSSSTC